MKKFGRLLSGAVMGFLVVVFAGVAIGGVFGMPTIDLPARGVNGMIWGAILFGVVFGIPAAITGAIIAALTGSNKP